MDPQLSEELFRGKFSVVLEDIFCVWMFVPSLIVSFMRLWVEANQVGREDRLSPSSFREVRLWPTHFSTVTSEEVGSEQVLVRLFFRSKMDFLIVARSGIEWRPGGGGPAFIPLSHFTEVREI